MAHNLIGMDIGRYHIVEQLGLGGMAVVYKAFDTRLEREVAIKVIRRDAFPPDILEQALKRFEREAKTLARMNHPNIVAVHDYGEFEGSPYLVMAYISGGTLRDRLHENGVPYTQAVRLLLPVARALDYAHSLNVVHRDVKPVNILMTASGEPMLSDFGIAKILENTGQYTLTGTHVGIGTPEYMSPEQGMGRTVDHRTDIYALGVVLFELVTGRRPYVADTPMAVVFMHLSDPLPRPRDLVPTLPEAVEQIIFKAMAKRPEDRYQNTAEMAAALEVLAGAAVDHQDVHFHNEEALTHPLTSSLPGKTAPGKIEHTPAPAAPTPAASRTPAEAPAPLPEQDKEAAPPAPTGRDLAENTPLPPAAGAATVVDNPPAAVEKHLPPAMMTIHDAVQPADTEPVSQSGSPQITAEWPTQVQPKKQPGKTRLAFSGWKRAALIAAAMLLLIGLAAAGVKRLFAPPAQLPAMSVLGTENTASINQTRRIKIDRVNQLTYSPGGVWIAAATPSGIDLIDAKTLVRVRHIDAGGTVFCAAFAPDGQTLAAGLENGLVTIWLVANGSSVRTLKAHTNGVYSVTYSPDGSILATGSADTTIQLWNVNAEFSAQPLTGHTAGVESLAFAPDGKTLASGSADNTIRLWRAVDGALIHEISLISPVRSVAFSPDGLILASASDDTIVRTWQVPDGSLLNTMQGHSGMVNSLAFSPDGQVLVSGSADNTLRLWQVPDGRLLRTLEGSTDPVSSVDFAPDGKALASGSSDGTIRLWGIPNQ